MPIPIDAELNRTAPRCQAGKLTPANRRAGPAHRRAGVLAKAPEDPPAVDAAPADPHPASAKNASNTSHRGRTLSTQQGSHALDRESTEQSEADGTAHAQI